VSGAVARKPSWSRRVGYGAAALALGLAVHAVLDERAYARLEASWARVPARIVRVEVVPASGGKKPHHVVHYEVELGGVKRQFSDGHGTSRIGEFFLGTPDVLEGPSPRVAPGKTIALLVNPSSIDEHRADRDALPRRWMVWLDKVLTVGLLAAISAVSFWLSRRL
jgi:hypothetical protein